MHYTCYNRIDSVSAKQRDSDTSTSVNRPWDFSAYKCFYPDCIPPPDKDFQEPADERQNPFYLWDNLTMWNATEDGFISNSAGLEGIYGIPKTYDSVKIITGRLYLDTCTLYF
jgi:hypothetical protein